MLGVLIGIGKADVREELIGCPVCNVWVPVVADESFIESIMDEHLDCTAKTCGDCERV